MDSIVAASSGRRAQRLALLGLVLPLLAVGPRASAATVSGRVRDAGGAAVAGAQVVLLIDHESHLALTSSDGAFGLDSGAAGSGRLSVRAAGFVPLELSWSSQAGPLEIVLERLRLSDELTVTAARGETRLGDEAARVLVLGRESLQAAAAIRLDDVLRGVPGFSLFRRSSSQVANPTAQGVSLRGLGASGASRALVVLDGVPQNDAFGGWVYWSRLPRLGLERVEIFEGGASSLYGSSALGGVVQGLTRTDAPALAFEAVAGDRRTGAASLYAAARAGDWRARLSGEAFSSAGYVLVSAAERGAADSAAGSRHGVGSLTLERRLGRRGTIFGRASALGESRRNGTPLQVNDTGWWQLSGGGDWQAGAGTVALRAWRGTQTYHQSFSAVSTDRSSEALTRRQRVPSSDGGVALTWARPLRLRHALTLGAEGSWVRGRSDETAFASGNPLSLLSSGGRARRLAFFAQDRVVLGSRVLLAAGLRVDHSAQLEGSAATISLGSGASSLERSADRNETAVSPRLSLVARVAPRLDATAAAYGAFRAPTLNELHRSFRVGDTLTRANPELVRERLQGAEAGLRWATRDGRGRVRLLGFLARVVDPVANVTLQVTPQLVTRQRQNLGRTRSRGLSLDAEARLGPSFQGSLGYAIVDAIVESFPADSTLEGRRLPQVPRHQLTLQARFADPRRLELAAELRLSSSQFEDDRNTLPLAGYWTFDARAARRIARGLELFVAVENASGRRYPVGATPTLTLGPPRLARAGLRFDWGGAPPGGTR